MLEDPKVVDSWGKWEFLCCLFVHHDTQELIILIAPIIDGEVKKMVEWSLEIMMQRF